MPKSLAARPSVLHVRCPARSQYVAPARHALAAFLKAHGFDRQALEDITTAAGEALANIVEHAYIGRNESPDHFLELSAKIARNGKLGLEVLDSGSFIRRKPLAGRGFGLRIIRAIAARLTIDTSNGTRLRMTFDCKR